MKHCGSLKAVAGSFYSRSLYREVTYRRRGLNLLHIWNLVALGWMPIMIASLHPHGRAATGMLEQIPEITISHGVASVDVPEPHTIKLSDGKPLAIIDTRIEDGLAAPDAPIVLTRRALVLRDKNEVRVITLPSVDVTINRKSVEHLLAVMGVVIILATLVSRFLRTLLYGLLAKRFAERAGTTLRYSAAVRLAALATSPAVGARMVLAMTGEPNGLLWFLAGFPLTIVYVRFGVSALAGERCVDDAPVPFREAA